MLTKAQFKRHYNDFLTDNGSDPIDNAYDWYEKSYNTKPFFKENFGESLKKTFSINNITRCNLKDLPNMIGIEDDEWDDDNFFWPEEELWGNATEYLTKHSGLPIDDFREKRLEDGRKTPKIVQGVITKAEKQLKKLKKDKPNSFYDIDEMEDIVYCLEEFKENINQFHQKNNEELDFKNKKYSLTISSDPLDFLRLGHFYCDEDSCFAEGRGYAAAKYKLAAGKNTFVAMANEQDSSEVYARCWGFYNSKNRTWHMSNMYAKILTCRHLGFLLKSTIEKINKKEYQVKPLAIAESSGIYNNKDGHILIPKTRKTISNVNKSIVYPNKMKITRKHVDFMGGYTAEVIRI